MNILDFAEKVKNAAQEILGDDYHIETGYNVRLNGVKLERITIHNKHFNISPAIYLDSFYEEYNDGKPFGEVMNEIIQVYRRNEPVEDIDVSEYTDFEKMKSHVCMRLCNAEKNADLLKEVPSIPFYDLAIIFYYYIKNDFLGTGQILIRNEHMDKWNVKTADIMKLAMENTPLLLQSKFCNIFDMLEKRYGYMIGETSDFTDVSEADRNSMWVLTNNEEFQGAAAILYPGMLNKLTEMLGDRYYIIPSSIHEVILVPLRACKHVDEDKIAEENFLKEIIKSVNENEVSPEEVLSNNLYYYDKCEGIVKLVS